MKITTYNIARIFKGYESRNEMAYESGLDSMSVAKAHLAYLKASLIGHGCEIVESHDDQFTIFNESLGNDIVYVINPIESELTVDEIKNNTEFLCITDVF